jgi:hypothetical protein
VRRGWARCHTCDVVDEQLHNGRVTILRRPSQRPISVSVHVRAVLDEELHNN